MLDIFSQKLVDYLIKCGSIDDYPDIVYYYKYGFQVAISNILGIVTAVLLGFLFGDLVYTLTYLVVFIILRQFTGGYHAKTFLKCNLIYLSAFSIEFILYSLTFQILKPTHLFFIFLITEAIVFSNCPVVNVNKPGESKQRKIGKILAVTLNAFFGISGVVFSILNNRIGVIIIYTLVLVSILIIISMISNKERSEIL